MERETVLVLTGYDLRSVPVVSWLSERFRVLLIASRDAVNQHSYPAFLECAEQVERWRWIDDVFDDYATFAQARRWHERYGIQHVVALDEFGVVCAAQIRELLGVRSGQRLESALAYRIKSRMYEYVAGSRVAVPEFRVASGAFDVLGAVRELGLPVVVKPVDGAAAQQTHVLRDDADADAWLRGHPLALPRPVLVQRYVDGTMYHVDGLTRGGEAYGVAVSQYSADSLAYHSSRSQHSTMLVPGTERFDLLSESVAEVLRVLPDTGGSSFHAEFFVTPAGQVYFCEVGSRTGGAGVRRTHERATGVHLPRAHALLQCGLADEVLPAARGPRPDRRYGWYLEYAPQGTLLAVPDRCDLPGVVHYQVHGAFGQARGAASSSVDAVQMLIVEARDDEGFAKTVAAIGDWCAATRLTAEDAAS